MKVVKKSLSFESASEESRALSPVSEVSDGLYSADVSVNIFFIMTPVLAVTS